MSKKCKILKTIEGREENMEIVYFGKRFPTVSVNDALIVWLSIWSLRSASWKPCYLQFLRIILRYSIHPSILEKTVQVQWTAIEKWVSTVYVTNNARQVMNRIRKQHSSVISCCILFREHRSLKKLNLDDIFIIFARVWLFRRGGLSTPRLRSLANFSLALLFRSDRLPLLICVVLLRGNGTRRAEG